MFLIKLSINHRGNSPDLAPLPLPQLPLKRGPMGRGPLKRIPGPGGLW